MFRQASSVLIALSFLTACAGEQDDIQAWMQAEQRTMVGRVEPLSEVKQYPSAEFASLGQMSPFDSGRIRPERRAGTTAGPDQTRPRQPLEMFPLESLQFTGVLRRNNDIVALVNVDNALHQIHTGSYVGQDYGLVTRITESDVTVVEMVQDENGDWVQRTQTLMLKGE